MLFSSVTFLYWFLPAVILLYFIVPRRGKNLILLLASLLFYFWGEPVYTLVLLASALIGWAHGLLIDRFRGTRLVKPFLISSLVFALGSLVFFKYSNFFIENINALFSSGLALLKLSLPIGISFYTFQILSYTIDVYRDKARMQKNPLRFLLYVSLFPQLIAGPIVRYQTVQDELDARRSTLAGVSRGIMRFVWGLGKKVIIADTMAELVSSLSAADPSILSYWLSSLAFTLQIYFDFSGYSDMAIGMGGIFGFNFPENFNYPYISKSVTEFWRRWHISLGTWFRDYVYIPLGGNRCSKGRWFFNVLVVWFLTGFWHGAAWNFIVWGLYFALFLLLDKLFVGFIERVPALLRTAATFLIVNFGFVLFSADSLGAAIKSIGGMFGAAGVPALGQTPLYLLRSYAVPIILALVLATPLAKMLGEKLKHSPFGSAALGILQPLACAAVLLIVTGYLVDGSFSPFLYFRF